MICMRKLPEFVNLHALACSYAWVFPLQAAICIVKTAAKGAACIVGAGLGEGGVLRKLQLWG